MITRNPLRHRPAHGNREVSSSRARRKIQSPMNMPRLRQNRGLSRADMFLDPSRFRHNKQIMRQFESHAISHATSFPVRATTRGPS